VLSENINFLNDGFRNLERAHEEQDTVLLSCRQASTAGGREESSMHTSLFGGQYIWKHHQLVVPSPLLVSDLSSNLQLRAALLGVDETC
jgi:hypothetical protein